MTTTKEKTNKPKFALNEEDFSILMALSLKRYRFLTCSHLAMLYDKPQEACEKRMTGLCDAGLVKRLHLPVIIEKQEGEPIYTLDRLGAHVLARRYHVEARKLYSTISERSYLFLAHSLAIVDFKVALTAALSENKNVRLLFWRSERELRSKRTSIRKKSPGTIPILPDAAFGIGVNGKQFFYTFEMDRGTTALKSEKTKMQGYIALYRKEEFRQFLNVPRFRVLVVTSTEKRLSDMLSALRSLDYCQKMFLFTTKEKITTGNVFGRVWRRASDAELHSILE